MSVCPHASLYKCNYKFRPKDARDYIFSTIEKTNNSIIRKGEILETVANKTDLTISTLTATTKTSAPTNSTTPTNSTATIKTTAPIYNISKPTVSILNQGIIGDCVCNAFSYAISFQTNNGNNLSRLLMYATCRILDGVPLSQDSGTTVSSACSALKNYGTCSETLYPYIEPNFSKFPPLSTYQNSKLFKTFTYTYVEQNLASIKSCLQTYNVPIIFGLIVYSSFMTTNVTTTGLVPLPNVNREKLQGGHCMVLVGYNDITQTFLCANSWGTSWGLKGYCNIPYTYLLNANLAGDFCFIQFS